MAAPTPINPRLRHSATAEGDDAVVPKLQVSSVAKDVTHDELPTLYRDTSFWGMLATQFFGAFNDNLFKQLVLLLSIAAVGTS